ncbi:beta-N-acetylhexosaminidase [Rubrivirga sp.]|uniref:beta-N-acetylhexosaminidase n=1 Tax=Rubrivirga sp. TaxID=1885344 RepID=UPI003B518ABF
MLRLMLALLVVSPAAAQTESPPLALVPLPESVAVLGGDPFVMTGATPIATEPADGPAARIGAVLDALVGSSLSDYMSAPGQPDPADPGSGTVHLRLLDRSDLGAEGYELEVTADRVTVDAATPAGLFYGVQTLRQLMPARVEYGAAMPGPFEIPAVRIVDRPRFAWRGMMLDVARHFFEVEDVERVLDLMALHKLNRLHLHLSDDQGWRVEVPGRPALTEVGGRSEVGGGPGGFYTTADVERIVRYAAERFVTVVPEIDLPGHTNAALVATPEITCDGVAPVPYTGIRVGFSAVCVDREETYTFVEDVVNALAATFPGEVVHLGGDEVQTLEPDEYAGFMTRAQAIVAARGKRFMAWDEVAEVDLALTPGAIVQVWRPQSPERAEHVARAVADGARLVLSPADRIYLDMKMDSTTALGLMWAGVNGVRDAYDWDPATFVPGVPEASVLGVEAPLWSETLATVRDIEFMAFPRLAGVAEIGWSPQEVRSWDGYRARLGALGARWTALGVAFFRSPEVDWAE